MSEARDLVFFYNGVEMTDESVENVPVALPLPMKSGTMRRGRKVWTVVDVRNTEPLSTAGNPVYRILVGSRASAILRRFRLSVAPRFLWECLISRTVSWVPAPATSNPSCRFPAMGLPVCFRLRVMGPTRLAGLSVVTMVGEAGNLCRVPASRKATSYSTFANRILFAPGPASDVPEPSSPPSL
jgi:hypothetical protein